MRKLIVVQFLVPKYNRNGKPYARGVHARLRKDLEERFDGWSSLGDKPLPGAWRNPDSASIEVDLSWRYEVGVPPSRLEEFDGYLAGLAKRLGQEAIWRVRYSEGEGTAIPAAEP